MSASGSSLVFVAEAGLPCVPGGRASGGEAPAPELAGIYRMTLPSGDDAAAGTFSVEANGHAHGELTTGTGEFVALRGHQLVSCGRDAREVSEGDDRRTEQRDSPSSGTRTC